MKLCFVLGWCSMLGNVGFSQIPTDHLKYYRWEEVQAASPDTIIALDLSRQKWTDLPEELEKFKNLKGLRLTKNKLSALPSYFTEFTHLEFLYLNKNKFVHFPIQICAITSLSYLDVSRNRIFNIPEEIKYLQHLKYIDLWDNRIEMVAPSFAQLQQLERIDWRGTTFAPSFVEKWTNAFPNAKVIFDNPCNCLE